MPTANEEIQAIKMVCSEILAQAGLFHHNGTSISIDMNVILNASKILSKFQNYREEFRIFGVDVRDDGAMIYKGKFVIPLNLQYADYTKHIKSLAREVVSEYENNPGP